MDKLIQHHIISAEHLTSTTAWLRVYCYSWRNEQFTLLLYTSDNTLHQINTAPQMLDPPYLCLWIKWHGRPGHGGEIFLETRLIFIPANKHYLQIVASFFPVFIKIDQQRGKVPAWGTPVCREIKAHHAPRPTERPHGHLLQTIPGLTKYMGPQ